MYWAIKGKYFVLDSAITIKYRTTGFKKFQLQTRRIKTIKAVVVAKVKPLISEIISRLGEITEIRVYVAQKGEMWAPELPKCRVTTVLSLSIFSEKPL